MLKPKPYLLLNCFLGRNIGSWKISASHSLYIHYVYIGCSYKRKSTSQKLREQLQLYPRAQIEDSSNSKWISKTLCFVTFCQGVLLHILLKRNRKPSASRTLGCHLAPLRWANLGGTFQYLYLLPIGKTLTLVLTIFHLWLTCNFLLFFLPGLYYSPPVISLKCPEKKLFSSVLLINSCFKFHVWLPTDFQVPISPWNDSYSEAISLLPLQSSICFNNFLQLSWLSLSRCNHATTYKVENHHQLHLHLSVHSLVFKTTRDFYLPS